MGRLYDRPESHADHDGSGSLQSFSCRSGPCAPAAHVSSVLACHLPCKLQAAGSHLAAAAALVQAKAGAHAHAQACVAGPSRRKLKVQNAEKYHWRPRQLLAQICRIYAQLAAADKEGTFTRSIALDERCYRPGMFDEAAQVFPPHSRLTTGRGEQCHPACTAAACMEA